MDSLKLAEFFFERVSETIRFIEYIKEIEVSYYVSESYGNHYINITYQVIANEAFDNLPYTAQKSIFLKTPQYTFQLSTHSQRGWEANRLKILKIIAFKNSYEALTSYIVMQLDAVAKDKVSIKVQSTDFWPEGNYAERHLCNLILKEKITFYDNDYSDHAWQWLDLQKLSLKSQQQYSIKKKRFAITDQEIQNLTGLSCREIRSLSIRYSIPISIVGTKTIDLVYFHIPELIEAIKKELNKDYYSEEYYLEKKWKYQYLIEYLYHTYASSGRLKLLRQQQAKYLQEFLIQKGDIVELKDSRVVLVDRLRFGKNHVIQITYRLFKTNLDASERTRTISINNVSHLLKASDFEEFVKDISLKRLSILARWMQKRKRKILYPLFELHLTAST